MVAEKLLLNKKSILIIFLFVVTTHAIKAQAPTWIWAKSIGDFGNVYSENITNDGSGNIYITGSYSDTLDFDPGPGISNLISNGYSDIFFAKYDSSGNLIWAKGLGSSLGDYPNCILIDSSGDLFIGGSFQSSLDFDPGPDSTIITSVGNLDAFIAKFDTAGNFIWVKSYGGVGPETVYAISMGELSHNLFCTGDFNSTADFDPGPGVYNMTSIGYRDIYLMRLDSSGNFIWAKQIGGSLSPNVYSLKTDNLENIFIAGQFSDTVDFDTDTSHFDLISVGDLDPYTAKYDSSGKLIWAISFGGPAQDWGRGMSISESNYDVYTVGYFGDSADFDPGPGVYQLTTAGNYRNAYVSCFDSSGLFKWVEAFYTDSESFCHKITVDKSAGHTIYISGAFSGIIDIDPGPSVFNLTSAGFMDGFLVSLDSLGNFNWAKSMGGSSHEGFGQCCIYNDYLYLVGDFASSSVSFDSIILSAAGPYDVCFSKLQLPLFTSSQDLTIDHDFLIYPNPASTNFTVSLSPKISSANSQLSIYTMEGREIHRQEITRHQETLNCQLPTGIYLIKVNADKDVFTQKLIVE